MSSSKNNIPFTSGTSNTKIKKEKWKIPHYYKRTYNNKKNKQNNTNKQSTTNTSSILDTNNAFVSYNLKEKFDNIDNNTIIDNLFLDNENLLESPITTDTSPSKRIISDSHYLTNNNSTNKRKKSFNNILDSPQSITSNSKLRQNSFTFLDNNNNNSRNSITSFNTDSPINNSNTFLLDNNDLSSFTNIQQISPIHSYTQTTLDDTDNKNISNNIDDDINWPNINFDQFIESILINNNNNSNDNTMINKSNQIDCTQIN